MSDNFEDVLAEHPGAGAVYMLAAALEAQAGERVERRLDLGREDGTPVRCARR